MIALPPDIEIAQSAPIRHIRNIASQLGIEENLLEYYGKYKAKLPLSLINEEKIKQHHLILVTAMTPTPAGEGKTTVSIGLTDGMNKIGARAMAVLREPSLGPVFGMKGGAAGGGFAQVIPMEDINLHFTGDFAAVEKANNLLSAIIDNHLQHSQNGLAIDPRTIVWKRVMDMNDRALRNIIVGLGGRSNGVPREDGFNITAASEIMAILCLAQSLDDLKKKLGNIFVGTTYSGEPVFARDLNAVGAMAALLKDAIKPNLVQTLAGNPVILHGGPFASIAQGTNSVLATKMGLSLSEYVITEAGFGADLGAEKFFDIKCVAAGLNPEAVVIVATVRALKHHGGLKKAELSTPNVDAVRKGLANLEKHLDNVRKFNLDPVVAINFFDGDDDEEIESIKKFAQLHGVKAIVCTAFANGGDGATELAEEVVKKIKTSPNNFQPLYNWNISVEEKIHCIATQLYGAKGVEYSVKAKQSLRLIK